MSSALAEAAEAAGKAEEAAPAAEEPVELGEWSEKEVTEARVLLLEKMAALIGSVATHPEGRSALRRLDALPLLLVLLQPPLADAA